MTDSNLSLGQMGARRFGRVNWLGTRTLAEREIRRFLNVWTQTLMAPMITAGLFLLVFNLAVGPRRGDVMGMPFMVFITPGVLMMTVIQNAFANTSSSILVAKVQGNIVDTLMPPLSAVEMVLGYVAGAIVRGLIVAVCIAIVGLGYFGVWPAHPLWALMFVVLGGALMGGLGIIAGTFANKFDQMAAITNFIVTPLAFLSGTFYSVSDLPQVMYLLSHVNPFFYLIDGVRYGVLGISDSSPWLGLGVCLATTTLILGVCWWWFRTGYRIKA
jgi:ABC-2 type transport system permease protein